MMPGFFLGMDIILFIIIIIFIINLRYPVAIKTL